jgi:hypothetical protein
MAADTNFYVSHENAVDNEPVEYFIPYYTYIPIGSISYSISTNTYFSVNSSTGLITVTNPPVPADIYDLQMTLTDGSNIKTYDFKIQVKDADSCVYFDWDAGNNSTGDGSFGNPYKSPQAISAGSFEANYAYLLKRDDVFTDYHASEGSIRIFDSQGTAGNWIIVGAYGLGDRPTIDQNAYLTGKPVCKIGGNLSAGARYIRVIGINFREGENFLIEESQTNYNIILQNDSILLCYGNANLYHKGPQSGYEHDERIFFRDLWIGETSNNEHGVKTNSYVRLFNVYSDPQTGSNKSLSLGSHNIAYYCYGYRGQGIDIQGDSSLVRRSKSIGSTGTGFSTDEGGSGGDEWYDNTFDSCYAENNAFDGFRDMANRTVTKNSISINNGGDGFSFRTTADSGAYLNCYGTGNAQNNFVAELQKDGEYADNVYFINCIGDTATGYDFEIGSSVTNAFIINSLGLSFNESATANPNLINSIYNSLSGTWNQTTNASFNSSEFEDYNNNDFRLVESSTYENAGTYQYYNYTGSDFIGTLRSNTDQGPYELDSTTSEIDTSKVSITNVGNSSSWDDFTIRTQGDSMQLTNENGTPTDYYLKITEGSLTTSATQGVVPPTNKYTGTDAVQAGNNAYGNLTTALTYPNYPANYIKAFGYFSKLGGTPGDHDFYWRVGNDSILVDAANNSTVDSLTFYHPGGDLTMNFTPVTGSDYLHINFITLTNYDSVKYATDTIHCYAYDNDSVTWIGGGPVSSSGYLCSLSDSLARYRDGSLIFRNVEFTGNEDQLEIYGVGDITLLKFYITLDAEYPSGTSLAEVNFQNDGVTCETKTFDISSISGTHDLYVYFPDTGSNKLWGWLLFKTKQQYRWKTSGTNWNFGIWKAIGN